MGPLKKLNDVNKKQFGSEHVKYSSALIQFPIRFVIFSRKQIERFLMVSN